MAKLTREVVKFLQVPLHKAWFGWCSALLGTVTVILQGLRRAELTKGGNTKFSALTKCACQKRVKNDNADIDSSNLRQLESFRLSSNVCY